MPKRKKLPDLQELPDISGMGRDNKEPYNWLIQKSKPLMTLSSTSMTLAEFKILDAYLSRIDSSNPDNRHVRFERGELEKLLGVTKINKPDLEKRLRNLFQVIEIRDGRKPKGFTLISLFSKAECVQDDNELWQVDLACSYEAMEYIFNIDNLGYLKYRLRNVINLTSRYSYILFIYLEDNRYRKSWEISLSELKQLLNCTADTYVEYKRFNDLVLKKCYKELNEKTECHFSYDPIKKGRKIDAIRFTLETQADLMLIGAENEDKTDEGQISFYDISNEYAEDPEQMWTEKYGSKQLGELAEAVHYEFTKEQMEEIFRILSRIDIQPDANTNSIHYGRVFYLEEKYAKMNVQEQMNAQNGEKIKNRYAYFRKMIEKDAK